MNKQLEKFVKKYMQRKSMSNKWSNSGRHLAESTLATGAVNVVVLVTISALVDDWP